MKHKYKTIEYEYAGKLNNENQILAKMGQSSLRRTEITQIKPVTTAKNAGTKVTERSCNERQWLTMSIGWRGP